MTCPKCSSPLPEDAKFCPICGSPVNLQPADAAPAESAAPAEGTSAPVENTAPPVSGGWYESSAQEYQAEPAYTAEPVYTAAPVKATLGSILDFYREALAVLASKPIRLWGLSLLYGLIAVLISSLGAAVPLISLPIVMLLQLGFTGVLLDGFHGKEVRSEQLFQAFRKEELLRKADLISLHAPLVMGTNGTYHLIDDDAIALMKDNVMLVNTSRGPLVDPEALIRGLKANKFHCVALDVYEGEDPNVYNDRSDEMIDTDIVARLTMFPNLILTSHQAFFTREALQAIAAVTMENARNFNEGLPYGMSEVK